MSAEMTFTRPARKTSATLRRLGRRHTRFVIDVTGIRATEPTSFKLTPHGSALFNQVRDDLALPAVQPAGQPHQHQLQRRRIDHEPELHHGWREGCRADL